VIINLRILFHAVSKLKIINYMFRSSAALYIIMNNQVAEKHRITWPVEYQLYKKRPCTMGLGLSTYE
jgi:hypothetical protein